MMQIYFDDCGYPMCGKCQVELKHEEDEIYCCPECGEEVLIDCHPADKRRIRRAWAV
jgi:predicted RNA-binding Zn-ribbon protein involved in translation (DUF1610 family)